jgi:hypothetical protein
MNGIRHALTSSFATISIAAITATAAAAATAPDADLYTNYWLGSGFTSLNYVVCGSTQESEGCYSAGTIGPFGRVGALVEGNARVAGDTVTRNLYVVDIGAGSSGTAVTLYRYEKTDSITSSYDTTTIKLLRTVSLPLVGGATALCSMVANPSALFIGTDQSGAAVEVALGSLSVTQIGGFSPPVTVSSITEDAYGYVTVTFGGFTSGENGFYVFGPNGSGTEDGGGAQFMLNSVVGLSTKDLPTSAIAPASRVSVRAKSMVQ